MELGSSVSFKDRRWWQLWVGETVELGSWMGVTVLMRIGDGSLRFDHGRFRDLRFGHGRFRDLREGVDERWV